jgi:transposase
MEIVNERWAGLDIHKRTVVACVLTPSSAGPRGEPERQLRTFGTMTEDLLALGEWLAAQAVTPVALESSGSYWHPVWNLLEERFTLRLVNARHVRQVPGRKTDVWDAEWLATLLGHGLLRARFVPDRAQRELRELVRYRTALVQEQGAESNRLQKVLEGAKIKLAAVVTDIRGKSARAQLAALIAGETDARALADLARGRLRAKLPALQQALNGDVGPHQRFLLARQLAHLDALDALIAEVSDAIAARRRPAEAALERLDTIPGVGRRVAEVLAAEIGTDVARFPTAAHLASWAGLCPGQHESAGKRQSGKTRQGSKWLRSALVEAAQAAGRTKDTYLAAQYQRLVARRGKKRATVAVGHTILVIAYHLLRRGTTYEDLGPAYFDERRRRQVERRLVQRLQRLGYTVTLTPLAPPAA